MSSNEECPELEKYKIISDLVSNDKDLLLGKIS